MQHWAQDGERRLTKHYKENPKDEQHGPQHKTFFHLTILLFVFLKFTASEYPFGIFKLFVLNNHFSNVKITLEKTGRNNQR
jgi:hypothetical protein